MQSVTMPFVAALWPRMRSHPLQVVREDRKQHFRESLLVTTIRRPNPNPSPSLSSTETLHNIHDNELDHISNVGVSVNATPRHICNPRDCYKRASSSQTPSPSREVFPRDFLFRSSSLDRTSFTTPYRNPKVIIKGSPLTLSPRSSIEFDHDRKHQERSTSATSAVVGGNESKKAHKRTSSARKAFGLFHRKKPSTSTASAAVAQKQQSPPTPPPGRRPLSSDVESPFPATPPNAESALPPHAHDPTLLPQDLISNASGSDDNFRRRRSIGGSESIMDLHLNCVVMRQLTNWTVFRFRRKRKSGGLADGNVPKESSPPVQPLPLPLQAPQSESDGDHHHTSDDDADPSRQLDEFGRPSEPEHQRKDRSTRRCRSRKRTAPPQSPPRTRPYEAPYNFPSPLSPYAADYVQRIRDQLTHPSNTPQSQSQSQPQSQPQPNTKTNNPTSYQSQSTSSLLPIKRQKRSRSRKRDVERPLTLISSLPSAPKTAPPQNTVFIDRTTHTVQLQLGHRRTASGSGSGSGTGTDEFGLLKVKALRRPATASEAGRLGSIRSGFSI